MARILFLHGLAGTPGGERVEALRERGHDVYAPTLPYAESRITGLMMSLVEQWQRDGGVTDPLPRWTQQAQAAFDEFEPDLLVGISLGAILAMRLNTGETPLLLVAPPWRGRVDVGRVLEQILPPVPPVLREWVRPLLRCMVAAVATEPEIKPATLILHSPADEVVDAEDSYRLLRLNPVSAFRERAGIAARSSHLSGRGYRPLFRRLVLAGRNHACDCPEGLTALADAADAALDRAAYGFAVAPC